MKLPMNQSRDVAELQSLRIERGYPVLVDGSFGEQTYAAGR